MSYQVLARKWRPQTFAEMVGQRHVLTALVNALDNQRLHHAYLFTGTRGVGKTTLARLFAKSLNCEVGVSSQPCGQCSACVEIAENRFIDLIEVDAASRTKVEDTRELLENVQYQPTRGRYKVYLIDEVHMLSNHSFNALLKTLEEPPPHVKFLLATTDPQKLPVTVLSRCLQFNLKSMTPDMVVDHLRDILQKERIEFEDSALIHLGKAAQGSMRDALSLTDQAVAYGQGRIQEADVAEMLGTVDTRQILSLIEALMAQDANKLLRQVAALAEFAPNWQHLMADVLTLLHQLAVLQAAPQYAVKLHQDALNDLAARCAPDDLQLYYQLGLQAHKDLAAAPEARQGFEMALLRMLAFTPDVKRAYRGPAPAPATSVALNPAPESASAALSEVETAAEVPAVHSTPAVAQSAPVTTETLSVPEASEPVKIEPETPALVTTEEVLEVAVSESDEEVAPPWAPEPPVISDHELVMESVDDGSAIEWREEQVSSAERNESTEVGDEPDSDDASGGLFNPGALDLSSVTALSTAGVDAPPEPLLVFPAATQQALDQLADDVSVLGDLWPDIIPALELPGLLLSLVANSEVVDVREGNLTLLVDESYQHLYQDNMVGRLIASMDSIGCSIERVTITYGRCTSETLNQRQQRLRREAYEQAKMALQNDPFVQTLQQELGGVLLTDTIEPIGH